MNPITHPSFTLMFCITSNPCGPSSDSPAMGFKVKDEIAFELSLLLSSFEADNAEEGGFWRQFGALSMFPI